MITIKEPLEDILTEILWTYMSSDHDLHAITAELLDHGNSMVVANAGYSKEDFIKGNATLIKGYIALNLMAGTSNPLYSELHNAMLDSIDFVALATKFYEEN